MYTHPRTVPFVSDQREVFRPASGGHPLCPLLLASGATITCGRWRATTCRGRWDGATVEFLWEAKKHGNWANYNDLIVLTQQETIVFIEKSSPFMAELFRLVNQYYLPRRMEGGRRIWEHMGKKR